MKLLRLAWRGTDFPGKQITADLDRSPELRRGFCMRGEWMEKYAGPHQVLYLHPHPENSQRAVALAKESWKPDFIGWTEFDPDIFELRPEPQGLGLRSDTYPCIGLLLDYEPA